MGVLLSAFGRPDAWSRRVVTGAVLVAAAVLLTGASLPAAATSQAPPSRSAVRVAPAITTTEPLTAPDPISARTIAQLEGRPVEVMSERTPTTQVYAMPDGTTTMGAASGPVWVRRGGDGTDPADWAPVDLTLVRVTTATSGRRRTSVT